MDTAGNPLSPDHGGAAAGGEAFRADRRGPPPPLRQPLVEVIELMQNNLEEPLALDELAFYAKVSRRQLERLFLRYLQCSPSRYYLRLRLERARQLLRQSCLSVADIAAICGFVSTPHFSRCYRHHMGPAPRDERRADPLPQGMRLAAL